MFTLDLAGTRRRRRRGNLMTRLFARMAERARTRRDIAYLSAQPDRLLRDIGLTRDQIRQAVRDGQLR